MLYDVVKVLITDDDVQWRSFMSFIVHYLSAVSRLVFCCIHLYKLYIADCLQGDHLSGKPGNVRQFDSYLRTNVRELT